MSSRLNMTIKNAFWSYFSMLVSLIIQFVSRTVFIHYLGDTYLGINGLYTNILGVLSFAELGIGTAMNYSLYKPVAKGDKKKIQSYMFYYKWAYRCIALLITVLGLILTPFLSYLVKDPGDAGNITVYYLIFLFNTVTSYFVSYKYSLVNAEQKNYIYTNTNLIISFTQTIVQIVAIILFKNYVVYLMVGAVCGVIQKIFISYYLNKLYPYLKEKHVEKLSKDEKNVLVTKVKALVAHKIGEVSVHQTDNIIISAFVSVRMVGLLSNYNLIINTVSSYINVLFNSVTGSLGNMVAMESKEHQYEIFKVYRFIGFWFYGFTSIVLFLLLSPFITLWIGDRMVVDEGVIFLIILNYYMTGHRVCLNNIKTAAGLFEQDKYIAVIQAVVNLVVSIGLVNVIGVRGVYVGTVIQGLISTVIKPIIVYKNLFGISSVYYFIDSLKYLGAVIVSAFSCIVIRGYVLTDVSILGFIVMMIVVTLIPNLFFLVLFHKRSEFAYMVKTVKRIFSNQ